MAFALGMPVGAFGRDLFSGGTDETDARAVRESGGHGYDFIDPLLACDIDSTESGELRPLRDGFVELVDGAAREERVAKASVYFRDMKTGRWTSVNAAERYAPASLQKLPLAIGIFKLAKAKPELLTQKIHNDRRYDHNEVENYAPSRGITSNSQYSVEALVRAAIVHSDNNAADLLVAKLGAGPLFDAYVDLGLSRPELGTQGDAETIEPYAMFFRVLYGATYLKRDLSEKMLEMLAEVEFGKGIVAGVPSRVKVAHKFGERSFDDGTKELHECGIVYYPLHPYLLCVMTKGRDFDALADALARASRLAYTWVDGNHLRYALTN